MRARWIEIATVRSGHFAMFGQWGTPGAFYVHWRGRVGVFQPVEFRNWDQIIWAVRRRLHLAGLDEIAIACARKRECVGPGGLCGVGGSWDMTVLAQVIVRVGGKWKPKTDES